MNHEQIFCKKCLSRRILIGKVEVGKIMFMCVDCKAIWYEKGHLERYKPVY